MADGSTSAAVPPLVEGEDYYVDDGLMVLTAHYHRRRGYCCERGCRHCPFKGIEKRDKDAENNETTE
jgi:hypothetical protein